MRFASIEEITLKTGRLSVWHHHPLNTRTHSTIPPSTSERIGSFLLLLVVVWFRRDQHTKQCDIMAIRWKKCIFVSVSVSLGV